MPEPSDKSWEMSDGQDLAAARIDKINRETRLATVNPKIRFYSFTIKQPAFIYLLTKTGKAIGLIAEIVSQDSSCESL